MNTVTPYVEPHVERAVLPVRVSLSAFKDEDIAEYLRRQGYQVNGTFSRALLDTVAEQKRKVKQHNYKCTCDCDCDEVEGLLIDDAQISRVSTLLLCGQRDAAREFVFQIVSEYIGRSL